MTTATQSLNLTDIFNKKNAQPNQLIVKNNFLNWLMKTSLWKALEITGLHRAEHASRFGFYY